MQKKKKQLPVLVVLLLTFTMTFISSLHVCAEPMKEIQLDVSGGFSGIAKLGAWSPIQINVRSLNRNITGEIQVEANLDQSRKVIVAKPVTLTAGSQQQIYFEIPVVSAQRDIQIRLVEGKKTIAEQAFSFNRFLRPEVMQIGVLSDDPEAFGWLNGNTVPIISGNNMDEKTKLMMAAGVMPATSAVPVVDTYGQSWQIRQAVAVPLGRDSFPDKLEVLDGFDFILVNQFDTALLSESQLSTLETWVGSGGVLILGTGLNWQKVYHGLPESLKLFSIGGTNDIPCTSTLKSFTGKETPEMMLRLAQGSLGFEYIPLAEGDSSFDPGTPTRFFDNDVVAGNEKNPLVIKYKKEMGTVLVFSFDPASEPFVSWQGRVPFFENVFKFVNNMQRFYERGNGFFQKQVYGNNQMQNLAREVPSDKKPPFTWMFAALGIYIIIVGPVLYIVLKHLDKRDKAWVWIPVLSIVFLAGMYFLGFKSRYNSAVTSTVSIIQVSPGGNEATVTSSIGIFNNQRGTLKLAYDQNNGLKTPFIQNDEYRYYGNAVEGKVVGKYTIGQRVSFEQYDVMLWTPVMLNAGKTIPFNGDFMKSLYLKDGRLQGTIENTSAFDLLDTMIVIGKNLIDVGDILSGDTLPVNISFDSDAVYKLPEEYLDGVFGRSYYNNQKDIPADYQENMQRRRVFENYIHDAYNMQQGKTQFLLLARNNQIIDYGLEINDQQPQTYHQNLLRMETDFTFEPGQEVEIPGGIIQAIIYQNKEVGWQQGYESIRVNSTGDMEFTFTLPQQLSVAGMSLSVEEYIPLYARYNMAENQNSNITTAILKNQYAYSLYNVKTRDWDTIDAKTAINEAPDRYIGSGNEVRLKITVLEMGQPDAQEAQTKMYKEYQETYLSIPEIAVWGVAK